MRISEAVFTSSIKELGGTAYVVGGWVRDQIMGRKSHDKDYAVAGLTRESFESRFPSAKLVGNDFPVYLLDIDGEECEIAFARTERKDGIGYKGFSVWADPKVTIEDDLYRRDLTINAMALRLEDGVIIDPYNGANDTKQGVIRPVSSHFSEDPVRALRAARQAACFGFTIADETFEAMAICKEELKAVSSERIAKELFKALEAKEPSKFFIALKEANILDVTFPWINALIGQTQPIQYHPEGDAFNHTMEVLDKVAAKSNSMDAKFCALIHDLGKGLTPKEELPRHYNHDRLGVEVLANWNKSMVLPRLLYKKAEFVITQHMRVGKIKKAGAIADFIVNCNRNPITLDELTAIIKADMGEVPALLKHYDVFDNALKGIDNASIAAAAKEKGMTNKIPDLIKQQRVLAIKEVIEKGLFDTNQE